MNNYDRIYIKVLKRFLYIYLFISKTSLACPLPELHWVANWVITISNRMGQLNSLTFLVQVDFFFQGTVLTKTSSEGEKKWRRNRSESKEIFFELQVVSSYHGLIDHLSPPLRLFLTNSKNPKMPRPYFYKLILANTIRDKKLVTKIFCLHWFPSLFSYDYVHILLIRRSLIAFWVWFCVGFDEA